MTSSRIQAHQFWCAFFVSLPYTKKQITMKVTTQDYTTEIKGLGKVIIPKGTRTTHQTADGKDEKYNFVDDFSWYKPELKGYARKMELHDMEHRGVNIPKEYVAEIITHKEWVKSEIPFSKFCTEPSEIDEDVFWHFLEALPPSYQKNGLFCCGEPYKYSKDDKPMYMSFTEIDKRFFYLGICTIIQAKEESLKTDKRIYNQERKNTISELEAIKKNH